MTIMIIRKSEHAAAERQAIIVAASGIYSFKGSGYVRGGIFDRIELLQDGYGTRFRDRDHERIGALEAAGAPIFKEIGLFMVPEDFAFDPTEPWELQLLVQRATGAREKAFLTFDLAYALPDRYIKSEKPAETAPPPVEATPAPAVEADASLEADVAAKPNIDWHHRLRHCLFDGNFLLPKSAR